MANHRVGETGLTDSGPSKTTMISPMHHQERSAFGFGQLEDAIVLQGLIHNRQTSSYPGGVSFLANEIPANPRAVIFLTIVDHFFHSGTGSSKSGGESTDSGSAVNTISSKTENQLEPESPISTKRTNPLDHQQEMASDISRTGTSQNQSIAEVPHEKRRGSSSEKQLDAKTCKKNICMEFAGSTCLRNWSLVLKQAYVQQLESSRIKLTQLEQDLQKARSQGFFLGGCAGAGGNISSGAAIFDRNTRDVTSHITMSFPVEGHRCKGRCFPPYNRHVDDSGGTLLPLDGRFQALRTHQMLISQLDPLTEQQVMGIYNLQHSLQQAEEALTQGLEQLQQSLIDTIAGGPIIDGMQQMAVALGKLANLEGFVRQGDNLRQQTLHRLSRILMVRQAARCFLMIGEYYGRLRALNSLCASRPRE
ncbi:BZIP transcription factor family protein isoform 3 [Hibiscus syriacus]|uniref:BZIP transcription factor family protein isoform 3 n=1 Tax=Hibiscus syriacus TaxID=106335 RepID=A0A6A2XG43_HIBSY|nr:BZIP transcription factor family protein isoform 3 [Hibiscus syriacus]